jgi:hypothetical protein
MATVLEYRRIVAPTREPFSSDGPCQIILFPGVRYERWGVPVKPDKKPKKPRRKRSL